MNATNMKVNWGIKLMRQGKKLKSAITMHYYGATQKSIYKITGVSKRRVKRACCKAIANPFECITTNIHGATASFIIVDEFYKLPE